MQQCLKAKWWSLVITGATVRTPAVGQGDRSFRMIKSLAALCSGSGLRLEWVPLAIEPARDHASFERLAQVGHVGPTRCLGIVPADGPLMVRIKQQPASTAEAQALRRLIDQGRWAKTQGLPKAFDWCVPLPHKGIPEGGEHKVMPA